MFLSLISMCMDTLATMLLVSEMVDSLIKRNYSTGANCRIKANANKQMHAYRWGYNPRDMYILC